MKYFGRCCSPCCTLISVIGALLLAAGLAGLLIALLDKNKNTTITTATSQLQSHKRLSNKRFDFFICSNNFYYNSNYHHTNKLVAYLYFVHNIIII